jgi:hypothetical protein
MKRAAVPYSVPRKVSASLARVRGYWEGLKRSNASMPFWDDVDPAALSELAGQLILMKVIERPRRFQFAMPGKDIGVLCLNFPTVRIGAHAHLFA